MRCYNLGSISCRCTMRLIIVSHRHLYWVSSTEHRHLVSYRVSHIHQILYFHWVVWRYFLCYDRYFHHWESAYQRYHIPWEEKICQEYLVIRGKNTQSLTVSWRPGSEYIRLIFPFWSDCVWQIWEIHGYQYMLISLAKNKLCDQCIWSPYHPWSSRHYVLWSDGYSCSSMLVIVWHTWAWDSHQSQSVYRPYCVSFPHACFVRLRLLDSNHSLIRYQVFLID